MDIWMCWTVQRSNVFCKSLHTKSSSLSGLRSRKWHILSPEQMIMCASLRFPAWDQCGMLCLANWICVLQCPWSQHPYGAWNNKQLCICVCVCLCVCSAVMAAERFINRVHQGIVGFTETPKALGCESHTSKRARQCLSKILIQALIFQHNNSLHSPP